MQGLTADAGTRLAHCLAQKLAHDPDLRRLVEQWEALPAALRTGILAMLDAAQQ